MSSLGGRSIAKGVQGCHKMGQKHGFCRRVKRGWGSKGKFLGPKGPLFCFESCTSHSPSPSILVMGLLGGEHGCSQRGANEKGKWKIKKRSKHWDGTLTMRLLTGRTDYMPADRVGWDNEEIWKLTEIMKDPTNFSPRRTNQISAGVRWVVWRKKKKIIWGTTPIRLRQG